MFLKVRAEKLGEHVHVCLEVAVGVEEGAQQVGVRLHRSEDVAGVPQGEPGEASSRLLGRENLVVRGHGARTEPVLVWAETGRTEGLQGTLGGLSGAPALDAQGRVLGVTIAESPRRGRIYTTAPEIVTATLAANGRRPDVGVSGEQITPQNYFYVADDLRRELQVAQVICLD